MSYQSIYSIHMATKARRSTPLPCPRVATPYGNSPSPQKNPPKRRQKLEARATLFEILLVGRRSRRGGCVRSI